MPKPVDDAAFHLGYWRDVLASEAIKPAAKHKVGADDLVQEALVGIWKERNRWKWPPEPSRVTRLLYGLASEMADRARNEARRRNRPRRERKPAQVPPLCARLGNLLTRVRNPRLCEDLVVSVALTMAPAELPDGRYREADLAWRQGKSLGYIAAIRAKTRAVVRKRLVCASKALERVVFDTIKNLLPARAERSLAAYRHGTTLADRELSELAEDLANVLERLHRPDDTDTDGAGTREGETRIP